MDKGYINFILDDEGPDNYLFNIDYFFKEHKQACWFNDDFAKKLIKEIDMAEAVRDWLIIDRWGSAMPPEYLSTGTKCVLLMKYYSEYTYGTSKVGANCIPFIAELILKYNCKVNMSTRNWFSIDKYLPVEYAFIEGKRLRHWNDFDDAYAYWRDDLDETLDEEEPNELSGVQSYIYQPGYRGKLFDTVKVTADSYTGEFWNLQNLPLRHAVSVQQD